MEEVTSIPVIRHKERIDLEDFSEAMVGVIMKIIRLSQKYF
jgi:hypothetical protein